MRISESCLGWERFWLALVGWGFGVVLVDGGWSGWDGLFGPGSEVRFWLSLGVSVRRWGGLIPCDGDLSVKDTRWRWMVTYCARTRSRKSPATGRILQHTAGRTKACRNERTHNGFLARRPFDVTSERISSPQSQAR